MLILAPYCAADAPAHARVRDQVRRSDGEYEVRDVYCRDDGIVEGWDFCVRPSLGPVTCCQMFAGVAHRLPPGATFLWLEPDCCLTRHDSLNRLHSAFQTALALNQDLCVWGHDKRELWANLNYVAGPAVYRTTPALLEAVDRMSLHKLHDMELGRLLMPTGRLVGTPLIRCFWHFWDLTRNHYYRRWEGDPRKIWDEFAHSAAMLHGEREGRWHEWAKAGWGR